MTYWPMWPMQLMQQPNAALADVILGEGMDGLSELGVDRLIEGVRERLSADTRAQVVPR